MSKRAPTASRREMWGAPLLVYLFLVVVLLSSEALAQEVDNSAEGAQGEAGSELDLEALDLSDIPEIDEGDIVGGAGAEESPDEEDLRYETVIRAVTTDDPPSATRVERERIERSPSTSIADLLEREAGVYASTGSRGERHILVRGFDQRQVNVVIDGVPAYLPYDGDLDLGKLPIGLVEDVVVLRPPGSLRYGPGGMGGTVSIRTRQPGEGPLLLSRFEGGRGRHYRLNVLHSHRAGPVSWLLGGGLESRDHYPLSANFTATTNEDGGEREQSDRSRYHFLGRARLALANEGWVELTAWHVQGEWSIPPNTVVSRPRYWRMTDWSSTVATLVHRWRPARGLILQEMAFVGLFSNLLDAFDDETYTSQDRVDSFHSWFHDLTAGGWLRARWALPGQALFRFELGGRYEQHRKEWELGAGAEVEPSEYARALVFLGAQVESWLTPSLHAIAGLQTEIEAGFDEATTPSADAMMSLRYDPSDGPVSVGFSVARRSRMPTLKERFSGFSDAAFGGRVPNPGLRPEVALHFGVDVTVRATSWLRLELTGFEAEVTDLIDLSPVSEESDQFRNVSRARQAGVELALGLTPWRWLDVELAYNYLYARAVSVEESGETSPLNYRPENLGRLTLRVRPLSMLEISTTARLVGPQQFQDPTTHFWRELGLYLAWDARVDVEPLRGVRGWVQVTNLLDANYQTQYGYPEPGWQLWLGIQLELHRR